MEKKALEKDKRGGVAKLGGVKAVIEAVGVAGVVKLGRALGRVLAGVLGAVLGGVLAWVA